MGINANVKDLIEYLSKNDVNMAKQCALAVLASDKAQGNADWRNRMQNALLNNDPTFETLEVPYHVQGLVFLEDTEKTFIRQRYHLGDAERKLFEQISLMKDVAHEMDELRIRYLNAVLLYGQSGCGKTIFGRYVANALALPFVYLNLSKVVDSLVGATSRNIATVFDWVRAFPCVLMLDEIDSISMRRSKSTSQAADKEFSRTTITLIQELDRLANNVVLLAATNRDDCIDEAIMRRLRVKHEVKRPDSAAIGAQVRCFLDDIGKAYDPVSVARYAQHAATQQKTQADVNADIVRAVAASIASGAAIAL